MFAFFIRLKTIYNEGEIYTIIETYEITKLDISRIYRYIDKYINDNFSDSYNSNFKSSYTDEYDIDDMITLDAMTHNLYETLQ